MARWYQNFSWFLLRFTYCRNLNKKYNIEVIYNDKEPDSPFFLLANHAHLSDPFIIGQFMNKTVNYMANVDEVTFMKRLFSDFAGAFSKKKGMVDMTAVKHTFKLIKEGHVVGIFAEGDRSWDGESEPIIEGIISIISKLKVPIRLASVTGGYLSYPRWAETKRRGKVFVEFSTISKEDVVSLSRNELTKKVAEVLYRNDLKDPRMQKIEFEGKDLALGIQYLLWRCPDCGTHDSIYGEDNLIICKECGKKWEVDGNQRIKPEEDFGYDLKDWNEWQKEHIKNLYASGAAKPFTVSKNIELFEKTDEGEISSGNGNLSLYKDKIVFSFFNKKEEIVFKNVHFKDYIDNFNKNFQFNYEHKRFKLYFRGQNSSKWIFFMRYIQKQLSDK